jgi:hypothetical protein
MSQIVPLGGGLRASVPQMGFGLGTPVLLL